LPVVRRRTGGWQIVASSEEQQVPPLGVNSSVGMTNPGGVRRQLSVVRCQLSVGQIVASSEEQQVPSARSELLGRDDKSLGGVRRLLSVVSCQLSVGQIVASSGEPQIPPLGLKSSVGMTSQLSVVSCQFCCPLSVVSYRLSVSSCTTGVYVDRLESIFCG
jgi:hypothetical protein